MNLRPSEAAKVIGCGTRHVRCLINQGKIEARQETTEDGVMFWSIEEVEVQRYRDKVLSGRGWPRGKKRA